MGNEKTQKISFWGEFKDKSLEREFFNYDLGRAIKYIKPITLILGILYMLFIVPDYLLIKNPDTFMYIFINRAVFMALVIVLYANIKKIENYTILAYWITIYEIIGIAFYLAIVYQYKSPNFLIQAFGVMVYILALFLAPNKWINVLIISIVGSLAFFILSANHFKGISFSEFSAGIVFILIVIVLSSIASYRTNYYKRKQYIDGKELLRLSITDPLTGIYNRAKFNEELERWMDYCKRYNTPLSLVLFDFDNFKLINDNYGHLVGDDVILKTVTIIKNVIRQTDDFARWGGEEFALLLPSTAANQAIKLTERLRILIANNDYEKVKNVTCSFGLVTLNANDTAEELLQRADKLLYDAKKAGKNTIAY
jgi:two-component system, cell cycle response regulator